MSTPASHGPRAITDRLDALEFKLRAEMAAMELRLSSQISGLAGDFREFRGQIKGTGIVIAVLVPVAIAVGNFLLWRALRPGG